MMNPMSRAFTLVVASLIVSSAHGQFSPIVDAERLRGVEGFVTYGSDLSNAGRWVAPAGDVNADGVDDLAVGAFGARYLTEGDVIVTSGAGYVVFGRRDGAFPSKLVAMTPDQGFALHYSSSGRFRTARSIGTAGDFNGDGIDDFVVTAGDPLDDVSATDSLVAVIVFGRAGGWPALTDLADIPPEDGVRLEASGTPEWSRTAVATRAGDINGDGLSDVVIGSPHAAGGAGSAFVVFGTIDTPRSIELGSLNGGNGFAIIAPTSTETGSPGFVGTAVAAAGDVNADGLDDVIIGAPGTPRGFYNLGNGQAVVIFGQREEFSPSLAIDEMALDQGFVFENLSRFVVPIGLGAAVAGVGDTNGDGVDDFAVSATTVAAPTVDASRVYLIYGRPDLQGIATPETLGPSQVTFIEAPSAWRHSRLFGLSLAAAGDINVDGFADLMIGSVASSTPSRTYVVFGGDLPDYIDVEQLDGTDGFVMRGRRPRDWDGFSVANVGDVNDDGIDDVCMGARLAGRDRENNGAAYVLFGGGYCRLDINADGVVDAFDVLAFQNDIEQFEQYTDWDFDGLIPGVADYQAFLADFAAGCP